MSGSLEFRLEERIRSLKERLLRVRHGNSYVVSMQTSDNRSTKYVLSCKPGITYFFGASKQNASNTTFSHEWLSATYYCKGGHLFSVTFESNGDVVINRLAARSFHNPYDIRFGFFRGQHPPFAIQINQQRDRAHRARIAVHTFLLFGLRRNHISVIGRDVMKLIAKRVYDERSGGEWGWVNCNTSKWTFTRPARTSFSFFACVLGLAAAEGGCFGAFDDLAADGDFFDVAAGGDFEHDVEHHFFENGAQGAGTGSAFDGLVSHGAEGVA